MSINASFSTKSIGISTMVHNSESVLWYRYVGSIPSNKIILSIRSIANAVCVALGWSMDGSMGAPLRVVGSVNGGGGGGDDGGEGGRGETYYLVF